MLSDPPGARAEAIRALRTHIMAQHVHAGRRALAICAASQDVGCTFVAVNLAVALSQIGLGVLLIDANLRRPGVDAMLPAPRPGEGLGQALAAQPANAGGYIQHDVLPGLSVMYSGGVARNPQELLAGDGFRTLIDGCLRDFDVTIVDTPAANTCSDARRISTVIGYSLIVARKDKSLIEDIKTLIGELVVDHARVVGTVLNEA